MRPSISRGIIAVAVIAATFPMAAGVASAEENYQWHVAEAELGPVAGGKRSTKMYATFFNDSEFVSQTTACKIRKSVGGGEFGLPNDCDPATDSWWDNAMKMKPVVSGGRMKLFTKGAFSDPEQAVTFTLSSNFNALHGGLTLTPPTADGGASFSYRDHFVKDVSAAGKAATFRFLYAIGSESEAMTLTMEYKDKDGDWQNAGFAKIVNPDTTGMLSHFQRFSCADGKHGISDKFEFRICDQNDTCKEFTMPGCGRKFGMFKAAPAESQVAACEQFDIGLETEDGMPVRPDEDLVLALSDDLDGTFHADSMCSDSGTSTVTLGSDSFLTSVFWTPLVAGWHNVAASFATTPSEDIELLTQANVYVHSSDSSSSSSEWSSSSSSEYSSSSDSSSSESSWSSSDYSSTSSSYDSSYSSDYSSYSSSYESSYSSEYSSSSIYESSYSSEYSSSSNESNSYSSDSSWSSSYESSYSSDYSSYSSYCGYGYWSWQWWTGTWEWICDSSSSSYSSEYWSSSYSSDYGSSYSSDSSSYGNSSWSSSSF
jgi:hypothetical protein